MSQYRWIGRGTFLVRNPQDKRDTAFIQKGSIIPVELDKDRIKQLVANKQIELVDEQSADEKEFIKNQKKLDGLIKNLEKAEKTLDDLPADATDAKKENATKKVTGVKTKIDEMKTLIDAYDGGDS